MARPSPAGRPRHAVRREFRKSRPADWTYSARRRWPRQPPAVPCETLDEFVGNRPFREQFALRQRGTRNRWPGWNWKTQTSAKSSWAAQLPTSKMPHGQPAQAKSMRMRGLGRGTSGIACYGERCVVVRNLVCRTDWQSVLRWEFGPCTADYTAPRGNRRGGEVHWGNVGAVKDPRRAPPIACSHH